MQAAAVVAILRIVNRVHPFAAFESLREAIANAVQNPILTFRGHVTPKASTVFATAQLGMVTIRPSDVLTCLSSDFHFVGVAQLFVVDLFPDIDGGVFHY